MPKRVARKPCKFVQPVAVEFDNVKISLSFNQPPGAVARDAIGKETLSVIASMKR